MALNSDAAIGKAIEFCMKAAAKTTEPKPKPKKRLDRPS